MEGRSSFIFFILFRLPALAKKTKTSLKSEKLSRIKKIYKSFSQTVYHMDMHLFAIHYIWIFIQMI